MKSLLFFAATIAFAQSQPTVANARFESRALSGSLAASLQANDPTWFGYGITTSRTIEDNVNGGCELEEESHHDKTHVTSVHLEGSRNAMLLYRVANQQIEKMRLLPMNCSLDAGGLPFVWLSGVSMNASLDFLQSLVTADRSQQLSDGAIFAISQHDSPRAADLLDGFAQSGPTTKVREQAIFWLGSSQATRGMESLHKILARDADNEIREKVIFALSINSDPHAMDAVVEAAEHDSSPKVRSQALFWLAQKAGKKSVATIDNAIANDPDRQVKRQAVFALSQLPKDEGVPKLIEVARTQHDPEVRKQAFFWLGQSNDSRAVAFLKQILLQ